MVRPLRRSGKIGETSAVRAAANNKPDVIYRLPIMPSPRLIEYQWKKHGTCSGLSQEQYFAATRQAFAGFRPPKDFGEGRFIDTDHRALLARLKASNPGIPASAMALGCRGRDFSEMRICLSPELGPVPCGPGVNATVRGTGFASGPSAGLLRSRSPAASGYRGKFRVNWSDSHAAAAHPWHSDPSSQAARPPGTLDTVAVPVLAEKLTKWQICVWRTPGVKWLIGCVFSD